MELMNRIVRLRYLDGVGLLVTDVVGRVHILDDDLELVRSSPVLPGGGPAYAVAVADPWVITKDPYGNLARWSLETLDIVDYLDSDMIRDETDLLEGEQPSPAIHRGIAVWRDRVYTNNGYMQFMELDLESFRVERILPSPTGTYTPIEWICTEAPDVHAVSDKGGRLHLGSLDTMEFPTLLQLDEGTNLHRVRYDPKHDRFWVTQDSGDEENYNVANGLVTVLMDGTVEDIARFARDDVEFLEFSHDYERVYSGGFDGVLHIFDNSERTLKIERSVARFSHQLIDLQVGADGSLFLLSQDGELVKLTADGDFVRPAPFRRQCVWDIQPSLDDPATMYCATDDGVAVTRIAGVDEAATVHLELAAQHVTGLGFVRRVVPLEGGWLGITRDAHVFRARADGEIVWSRELETRAHTAAVDPTGSRILLATNAGGIELDAETGEELGRLDVDDLPLWCSAYLPDGGPVLGTRNGVIVAFDPDGERRRWTIDTGHYPKRMWAQDGFVYVTGGGGLKQISVDGSGITRRWEEYLNNTPENAVIVDGLVYIVTYGSQIGWFDYESCEMVGTLEHLLDFPKGLQLVRSESGERYLLVGGRGGYVSIYRLGKDGTPHKLRDLYLPRQGYRGYELDRGPIELAAALA
jgi:outer membrane protein assembly factor BamB